MNNLYTLTYDETNINWIVIKKNNIMGTDLVDLGLLKGSKQKEEVLFTWSFLFFINVFVKFVAFIK